MNVLEPAFNGSDMMDTESKMYEKLVEGMLLSGSTAPVSNSQSKHAAIIFKLFFKYAHDQVLIFCHNLDQAVFGDESILKAAMEALERGVLIHVITQTKADGKFLTWLIDSARENKKVVLQVCNADSKFADLPDNFTIMDEQAFRYEPKHDDVKAIAYMNNPKEAVKLAQNFKIIARALSPSHAVTAIA